MMTIKLTYFNIQGVAEKVRLALVLAGIPFEDVRVSNAEWGAMKLSTPYGQLPLMEIDGGKLIAQSEAMLRYVGSLATAKGIPLYPTSDPDRLLAIEEACGLIGDLQREWRVPVGIGFQDPTLYGYPPDFRGTEAHSAVVKAVRAKFCTEELPKYMGFLSKRLSASGGFLCGAEPTIADCSLVPVLARFISGGVDHVPRDCLEPYPEVVAYLQRFMAIEAVKEWYAPKEE
jgi:glutathione S-transferase